MIQFLDERANGYESLNEFISAAVANQLNLCEAEDHSRGATATVTAPTLKHHSAGTSEGLALRHAGAVDDLFPTPEPGRESLFVLTNRFGPIKIGLRTLLNDRLSGGGWPTISEFQKRATSAARALGLKLRTQDEAARRTAYARRWIGFPVGDDPEAAGNRYAMSFTIQPGGGGPVGPMALLGLANIAEGKVGLTEHGYRLAQLPTPLLDEVEAEGSLSTEEADFLRQRLIAAPMESVSILEFIDAATSVDGKQRRIDARLAKLHPEWSSARVSSHRGAMVGRLTDLAMVQAQGKGPDSQILLLDSAQEFVAAHTRKESLAK